MMKKNGKQVLFFGGLFLVVFAIWTALIQLVDVQPMGQNGTDIIILGVYYVIVILAYFIFEIIPISYRPILINGIITDESG